MNISQTSVQFRAETFDLDDANFGEQLRVVGSAMFGCTTNTRLPTGESASSGQVQFKFCFQGK